MIHYGYHELSPYVTDEYRGLLIAEVKRVCPFGGEYLVLPRVFRQLFPGQDAVRFGNLPPVTLRDRTMPIRPNLLGYITTIRPAGSTEEYLHWYAKHWDN